MKRKFVMVLLALTACAVCVRASRISSRTSANSDRGIPLAKDMGRVLIRLDFCFMRRAGKLSRNVSVSLPSESKSKRTASKRRGNQKSVFAIQMLREMGHAWLMPQVRHICS